MDNLSFGDLLGSLWGLALVAIFFGGSIFVHELGHFLAARKRGLKIERFSIGFGPRLFGWTGKDGVDYRVSIIPLGGYVALPQLADMEGIEGASSEEAEQLPKISYADKMIVSVMGAVFNVIFAFVLACVLWVTGMPVAAGSNSTVIGYVPEQVVTSSGHLAELGLGNTVPGPAFKAGLRSGDKVIEVDDAAVSNFNQISEAIMLGNRKDSQGNPTATFKIERGTETLEIVVQPARLEINAQSGDKVRVAGLQPRTAVIVGTPAPGSPAEKAGLKSGDRILSGQHQAAAGIDQLDQGGADAFFFVGDQARLEADRVVQGPGQPILQSRQAFVFINTGAGPVADGHDADLDRIKLGFTHLQTPLQGPHRFGRLSARCAPV
jgi:regulator of sigma E protease